LDTRAYDASFDNTVLADDGALEDIRIADPRPGSYGTALPNDGRGDTDVLRHLGRGPYQCIRPDVACPVNKVSELFVFRFELGIRNIWEIHIPVRFGKRTLRE
jgi:hypothetical protein